MAPLDHSFNWTSTAKEAFMLTSLVAEKASRQRPRERLAQCGALGGGSTAHEARLPKRRTTRWPNLTLLTRRELRTRSSRPSASAARMRRRRRGTAKAPKQQRRRKSAVGSRNGTKPASGRQTKQQTCLDLLGRREGATIEDLEQATGWQKHSVRGFLAGAVKKKLGLTLVSEKPDAGPRRYRIPTTA